MISLPFKRSAVAAALVAVLACGDNGTAPIPVVELVNCPPSGTGGDLPDRGFYVSSFPGTSLKTVELVFDPLAASGTDTLSLIVRASTYDGTLIGGDTVIVAFAADTQRVTFDLGTPRLVANGSTVTFALGSVGGVTAYFGVSTSNASCPVTQTEGTTPPLDTFRRNGIAVRMTGGS